MIFHKINSKTCLLGYEREKTTIFRFYFYLLFPQRLKTKIILLSIYRGSNHISRLTEHQFITASGPSQVSSPQNIRFFSYFYALLFFNVQARGRGASSHRLGIVIMHTPSVPLVAMAGEGRGGGGEGGGAS